MGGGPSRPRGRGISSSLYFSETESECSRSGSSLESGGEGCAPESTTRAGSRTPCSQCQCSCSEAGSVRTALHGTDTRMEMLRLCLRHEIEQLNSRAAARRVGAPARTIDGSTAPARRYAVYRQQRPFRRPRASARAEELVPFVLAYDEFLSGPLAEYLREAKKLGGDAGTHADQVQRAFQAQRDFIVLASKSKKPDDATTAKLLKPQADIIQEITAFREKNRRSPQYNHLSTISESIAALSWVITAPAPAPLVKEMNDAGLFWGNRVIKENKAHQAFTRAWAAALSALQAYVKQHHTTGLSWNMRGGDAAAIAGGDAAPAARGSGPPPPPPPPPPAAAGAGSCDSTDKQRAALFNEINRGAAVTQGLRHVTKNMQTHKNADLRLSSTVPGGRAAPAAPKAGGGRGPAAPKKPVCELQGKKWVVEHQDNNLELTLDQTQMNQVVYCFNCVDSVIQVKGKVNSIIMDTCKKSAVIFDSTVASVEFVNCTSCQMQVNEKVPTISIDKTDGLQMYLSNQSLDVVLVTSKSSEMNVLIPKGDGDYTELAVAEQFKTTIEGKKLVTVVNEST